jgi:hypothetical protein
MRELTTVQYSTQQFSDENLLLNFKLLDPVQLSKNLTWLWGKDSDEFPLTFLTEGNGAVKSLKPIVLNDTQYKWKIMGRMRSTSKCLGLANTGITKPGLNGTPFEIDFEDDFFKRMYTAYSPNGKQRIRFQTDGLKIGLKRVRYTVILLTGGNSSYLTSDQIVAGLYWVEGAPIAAASKSDGTSSNHSAPGEMTNQFGFHRYGYELAGNVSNKVTNIQFDLAGGGTTDKWIPFDFKNWELKRKKLNEEDLWYSEYNRDVNGVILAHEIDGEPIPIGAGIRHILTTGGQYDTYSTLTLNKLKSIVRSTYSNRVDSTPMELVMYTGRGGMEQFHNAIMVDAVANQYFTPLGATQIMNGKEGFLQYGTYFNQFKTIDGYILTLKYHKMFDFGSIAMAQRQNGNMRDGYPLNSFTMVVLDQSKTNDGGRNLTMVCEAGRELVTGIYKGMSAIPEVWGAFQGNQISTRKDISTFDLIDSQGIHFANYTTSFWLERV